MDTIVFSLILATFLSMLSAKRWLALGLFFCALVACGMLFSMHATDALSLYF